MDSTELMLVVRDGSSVQARIPQGSEANDVFLLENVNRRMIGIFEDWLDQSKISNRRELEVLGMLLYKALFHGNVERFFEQHLTAALANHQRLRIQLSFTGKDADLANLPWEYLYYPDSESHKGFFLATNVNVVLSHYMPLDTAREFLAPAESPLRILVVVSRPADLPKVVSDPVVEAMTNFAADHHVQLDILSIPTVVNLLDILEEKKPHVIHFVGHGRFIKAEERGQIAVLDMDESSAAWIGDQEFAEFFVQQDAVPRLVFLHMCESGAIDFTANYAGLAPQLIRIGVQAVVAMKYPITNNAAIIFSQEFYRELAKGKPIDHAVQNGRWRLTVRIPNAYDSPVFGFPVLYMRSWDGIIQPSIVK